MKNKEIEELLNELKDKYSYEPYDNTGEVYTTISYEEGQLLLSHIEQLEKENERLQQENQQLKKQKDDVVEYIKTHTDKLKKTRIPKIDFNYNELLRMLGEIDNE